MLAVVRLTLLFLQEYYVYALDVEAGEKLLALQGPKCQIGRLDVTDPHSITEFKQSLGDTTVDLLLNIAGQFPDIDYSISYTLEVLELTR